MQEQGESASRWQDLFIAFESKQYEKAQQIVRASQKNNSTISQLIKIYHAISFQDEDEYENFLYLMTLALSPEVDYHLYQKILQAILNQIIALTSLKYTIVIFRSFLCKLKDETFGKFAILSLFHIFYPLVFDATFDDLKSLYSELKQAQKQAIAKFQTDKDEYKSKIKIITTKSLYMFLSRVKEYESQGQQYQNIQLLDFLSTIIRDLTNQRATLQQSLLKIDNSELCLIIINKLDIDVTKMSLPLPFAVALLSQYSLQGNLYNSKIYSKFSLFTIILKTLCLQLPSDLNIPPAHNRYYDKYLFQFIQKLGVYLNTVDPKESSMFLINNFHKIQQLIEKVNIFIGAINPQEPTYKSIISNVISLSFLPITIKERVLSNLIRKHSNINFKTHLITQYRRLITFKVPKSIWIRSIDLLFNQLKHLQPNSSIDYIGHILSFAYYWKSVTTKFLEVAGFRQKLYFDLTKILKEFEERLKVLRQGLQTRVQIAQKEENQLQRNQINVCLFRIQSLLTQVQVHQTSKGK